MLAKFENEFDPFIVENLRKYIVRVIRNIFKFH